MMVGLGLDHQLVAIPSCLVLPVPVVKALVDPDLDSTLELLGELILLLRDVLTCEHSVLLRNQVLVRVSTITKILQDCTESRILPQ